MPYRVQVTRFASLLIVTIATGAAGCATQDPTTAAPPLASQVTIYRDSFGIPHVFGETDEATTFGFGYAQAEDGFRIRQGLGARD